MTNDVEAVAKQIATSSPGKPMPRNNCSVPRKPSRQPMKARRKAAAQNERQNTTVQMSSISMKRPMAPPRLHISADRNTRAMPKRSSRRETCGAVASDSGTAGSVMASVSMTLGWLDMLKTT